jgi:ketosteroid isomerase-like protein
VSHPRDEVEAAFKTYIWTGIVGEDWAAWSKLFTDDATFNSKFYGLFHGPEEIQRFFERTMSFSPHVYSPLRWYAIDGDRVVYLCVNRADNPEPGGAPFEFESLQFLTYAGDGRWSYEEDWWMIAEVKAFGVAYEAARELHDPAHKERRSRLHWDAGVDWARPSDEHPNRPTWVGRDDIPRAASLRDLRDGVRD